MRITFSMPLGVPEHTHVNKLNEIKMYLCISNQGQKNSTFLRFSWLVVWNDMPDHIHQGFCYWREPPPSLRRWEGGLSPLAKNLLILPPSPPCPLPNEQPTRNVSPNSVPPPPNCYSTPTFHTCPAPPLPIIFML